MLILGKVKCGQDDSACTHTNSLWQHTKLGKNWTHVHIYVHVYDDLVTDIAVWSIDNLVLKLAVHYTKTPT